MGDVHQDDVDLRPGERRSPFEIVDLRPRSRPRREAGPVVLHRVGLPLQEVEVAHRHETADAPRRQGELLDPPLPHRLLGLFHADVGRRVTRRAAGSSAPRRGARRSPARAAGRAARGGPREGPTPSTSSITCRSSDAAHETTHLLVIVACGGGQRLLDDVGRRVLTYFARAAWSSIVQLGGESRKPPRARARAISSPTTVSMFAPTIGRPMPKPVDEGIVRSRARRLVTGLRSGRKRKSSKYGRGRGVPARALGGLSTPRPVCLSTGPCIPSRAASRGGAAR